MNESGEYLPPATPVKVPTKYKTKDNHPVLESYKRVSNKL